MSHLLHSFKNVLVSSASGAALRNECLPHAAEAVGVDHTELLVVFTPSKRYRIDN